MFIPTFISTCFFSSLLLLAHTAQSSTSAYLVKQEILSPKGWRIVGQPDSSHTITLHIALHQPHAHLVETHLNEISDPLHERYGMYMSKEEIDDLVRPHPETLEAVDAWLLSVGIQERHIERSSARDWVILTLPIAKAEELLQTTYSVWTHTSSEDSVVRTLRFSIPRDLHDHIDFIQPTTLFMRMNGHRSIGSFESREEDAAMGPQLEAREDITDPACRISPTIRCIRQLYNVSKYEPSFETQSSIGITSFLGEKFSAEDQRLFFEKQNMEQKATILPVVINDESHPLEGSDGSGMEINLDVQYAAALVQPIPLTFWSTGASPPFQPDTRTPDNTNEPYLEFLDYILKQDNTKTPTVISNSYGDDEQTVPEDYARRVCLGFAQLGLRGVSVITSSGDWGVGDGNPMPDTHSCYTNDGTEKHSFLPTFPASCPFVTSVGGTKGVNPEVAVSQYASGGGFSNYFKRPSYQEKAVSTYMARLPDGQYEGLYNSQGRAFPDVSAQGENVIIYFSGHPTTTGGTSASAPIFASLIALLNDARLENGQPPLGFLNPILYGRGVKGLTDILVGSNKGCGTPGFNVTEGWDPVTGLGTPNFGKLAEIVVKGWKGGKTEESEYDT